METMYDCIIIGAGPGGYVAAERAGAHGKRVLLIEKEHLGGVCLNRGCIPTKSLLHAAKVYQQAQKSEQFGVSCSDIRFDLARAMAWKKEVIETLRKGVAFQMKRHNVEVLEGEAHLIGANAVEVGGKEYRAGNLIIATGSSPVHLPIPGKESAPVLDSTEILEVTDLPKSIAIIGGSYIGMEFASFFASVGVEVSVVEMMPEIIPFMDPEIAAMLRKSLSDVTFHLGSRVESFDGNRVTFSHGDSHGSIDAERILMAVGRAPNVQAVEVDKIGLDYDRKGIRVNDRMQTNVPTVYAIGDVTGKSLLAHSASRMGEVAVSAMLGRRDRMRFHAIPWVVYTNPEVAGCGMSEDDARKEGRSVKVAKLQLRANSRYTAEHPRERGICKVIVDEQTDVILGVHLLGAGTSEIIYGAAAMIEAELRVQDVKEIVFPHPTVSEIIRDTLWELH